METPPRDTSCGGVQPSGLSDRILFRKDWVALARTLQSVRVADTYYARERSDRAEGVTPPTIGSGNAEQARSCGRQKPRREYIYEERVYDLR